MEYDENEIMNWELFEEPYYWKSLDNFVIADRHLPNGKREHVVLREVPQNFEFHNANVYWIQRVSPEFMRKTEKELVVFLLDCTIKLANRLNRKLDSYFKFCSQKQ